NPHAGTAPWEGVLDPYSSEAGPLESDELLNSLPLLVVQVCDPLARLVLQVRKQPRHVFRDMSLLLWPVQSSREWLDEVLEPIQESVDQIGRDFRISEHFLQARLVTPLHGLLPS